MKKPYSILAFAVICLLSLSIMAASKSKSGTWTGWISDSGCGAKGTSADHKQCAVACVHDKGGKWVFVSSEGKKVSAIHNQDAVSDGNVGMEVKVTGSMQDDESIHVDSIAPAGM